MQNSLKELRLLAPYFRDRPRFTGAEVNYFTSPEYLERLDSIGKDSSAMARLTINLLEHIALDPLRGNRLSDFLPIATDSETVFVCLHLDRTVNFIGFFVLPITSPELPALAAAIEKNLASKKFKAAVMYRRLSAGNSPRFRRYEKAASAAYSIARQLAEETEPPVSPYASDNARLERSRRINEYAYQARDNVYEPAKNRLLTRIAGVGRQAQDATFQGGYYDILVAFAKRHLCPVRTVENCCA
jgi:hypothetical protein